MKFTRTEAGVDVGTTGKGCHYFCGVRASFEGKYYLPPAKCTPAAKKAAQARFNARYRAKSYEKALGELAPILAECGKTLYWLEEGQLRNDVAIAQYHLGRRQECLRTLAPTLKFARDAEKGEGEGNRVGLPPVDAESFQPIFNAAKFNSDLCAGDKSKRSK
ncbi:MAG: hypothetical protein JNJ55_07475 [Betaproteobacteria bacterium]|nr:hypothetical protein [Betaproteobacteria bacterium]